MIKYTMLKMTPEDYSFLNPGSPLKTIVFQFMLERQDDIYPKLRAYAMKQNQQKPDRSIFRDLQYLNPVPSAHLSEVNKQVTGNLQVKISDLETLIKNANPAPYEFEYLILTPKMGEENHIIYEISVVPTKNNFNAKTLLANPSPPSGVE